MTLRHHDLCFGCGIANLFGLQLELEQEPDGSVRGRFFVKQDHQGPPGVAHGGVVAAALDEAMSLVTFAQGSPTLTARVEVDYRAPAPIGAFLALEARIDERAGGKLWVSARASGEDGTLVAEGRALMVEPKARE